MHTRYVKEKRKGILGFLGFKKKVKEEKPVEMKNWRGEPVPFTISLFGFTSTSLNQETAK